MKLTMLYFLNNLENNYESLLRESSNNRVISGEEKNFTKHKEVFKDIFMN